MTNHNGTKVTWRQLIFLAGLFVSALGILFFLTWDTRAVGTDTRERVIGLEIKFDNLLNRFDKGEVTIKR